MTSRRGGGTMSPIDQHRATAERAGHSPAFRNKMDTAIERTILMFLHEEVARPSEIVPHIRHSNSRSLSNARILSHKTHTMRQERDTSHLSAMSFEWLAQDSRATDEDSSRGERKARQEIVYVKQLPSASILSLIFASVTLGLVLASVLRIQLGAFVAAYFAIAALGLGASTIGFLLVLNKRSGSRVTTFNQQ